MSYTKGPWRWERDDPDYPTLTLYGDSDLCVLEIYESHGGGQTPITADMSLIEVAPELLEELKRSPHDIACHPSEGYHTERCLRVRALITKAQGEGV